MSLGSFLSIASPSREPEDRIDLVPLGGLSVSVGAVTLGLGLLRA
jgi:hypothetical protein